MGVVEPQRQMPIHYDVWERRRFLYDGLVELIVNAMVAAKPGFICWGWNLGEGMSLRIQRGCWSRQ